MLGVRDVVLVAWQPAQHPARDQLVDRAVDDDRRRVCGEVPAEVAGALTALDDPPDGADRSHELADALRHLENGRTRTVAKLGRDGCATLEDGALLRAPAFPAEVVDTTGAGDSFNAGFLHAWLDGRPVAECLRWGAACGSLSTRGLGGTARQPDADEVEALLRSSP
jgi:sugar/nucleoside kinase (ribokinase family)